MDFVTCKLVHSILRSIYILIKLNDEGNPVALISYFHSAFDRITVIFDQEIIFTLEGSAGPNFKRISALGKSFICSCWWIPDIPDAHFHREKFHSSSILGPNSVSLAFN